MRAWLVAALGLAGCADVWGLSTDHGPPDAAIDAPPIDAPTDAFVCTAQKVTLPLVEDAVMIAQNPTMGHGGDPVMNIGVGEALLKFDATNLPAYTDHFTLSLPLVQTAFDCGAACGSCLLLDKPGTVRVAFLRSDWSEATASYNQRSTGNLWQAAGANGAIDRGPLQGMGTFAVATPLEITFTATDVDAWVPASSNRLSLVVSPFAGAVVVVRQHQPWVQACIPEPELPTLIADPCP